jgi:integrase/recombinase XerC
MTELVLRRGELAPSPISHRTGWREVVDVYLATLDSEGTRRAYQRHIVAAFTVLEVLTVADLTGRDLAEYRVAVANTGAAPATQAQALAAMRSFLKWAKTIEAHALPGEVVAQMLKTPRSTVLKPYNVLSEPELGAMLRVAVNPRDRAIVAVMLGGGLRVSEVVGLDVSDIQEDADGEAVLYVRMGKGRKDRAVPIRAEVTVYLRRYLAATARRLGGTGPLFTAEDRGAAHRGPRRLSSRAVGDLVEKYRKAAGIEDGKQISPHALRHTYALRALRAGANVVAVSKLLGHASISTTQRYVDHLAVSELRAAVAALPPV